MTFAHERLVALINIGAKVSLGALPIIFIPIYVQILGMSSYGVFAYALALMGIVSLIDLGLSPALTRAISLPGNRAKRAAIFTTFERASFGLGGLFIALAAVTLLCLATAAPSVFSSPTMTVCAWLAVLILLSCSWPISLYSGTLLGADQQLQLNMLTLGGAAGRYFLGLGLLVLIRAEVIYLLIGHAAGYLILAVLLRRAAQRCTQSGEERQFRRDILRENCSYAAKTWLIVSIGIAVAQIDKQVVAASFGLTAFSAYSISWALSSAAMNIAHPIGASYFPRSVAAYEIGNADYQRRAVRESLNLLTFLILIPTAVALIFTDDLLMLWLRETEARQVKPVLIPLILAAQFGAISALAQSFLTAFGKVGVIVAITVVQLAVMTLGMGWVTSQQGELETVAYVWIMIHALGAFTGLVLLGRVIQVASIKLVLGAVGASAVIDSAVAVTHMLLDGRITHPIMRLLLAAVVGGGAALAAVAFHKSALSGLAPAAGRAR